MTNQPFFSGLTPEQEKAYEEEATRRWGDTAKQSYQKWNRYTPEQKQAILAEAGENYQTIAAHMSDGADSPAVQAALAKCHQNLRHFYEPTVEILRSLGSTYNNDPDFRATFVKLSPELPAFLEQAITIYCDRMEGKVK